MKHWNAQLTSCLWVASVALALGTRYACAETPDPSERVPIVEAQKLSDQLNRAFSSRDVHTIARCGRAVREFKLEPNADDSARSTWRVEKLKLWLSAIVQAHNSIDPDFSASDTPYLNVTPKTKRGVSSISGMDPGAIQDEEVQKDYLDRIKVNDRKAASRAYQMTLRKLDTDWTHELQTHVSSEYTTARADIDEISEWIDRQPTDNNEKDKLRSLLMDPAVVVQGTVATAALIQE
jgi:hypothetical protein